MKTVLIDNTLLNSVARTLGRKATSTLDLMDFFEFCECLFLYEKVCFQNVVFGNRAINTRTHISIINTLSKYLDTNSSILNQVRLSNISPVDICNTASKEINKYIKKTSLIASFKPIVSSPNEKSDCSQLLKITKNPTSQIITDLQKSKINGHQLGSSGYMISCIPDLLLAKQNSIGDKRSFEFTHNLTSMLRYEYNRTIADHIGSDYAVSNHKKPLVKNLLFNESRLRISKLLHFAVRSELVIPEKMNREYSSFVENYPICAHCLLQSNGKIEQFLTTLESTIQRFKPLRKTLQNIPVNQIHTKNGILKIDSLNSHMHFNKKRYTAFGDALSSTAVNSDGINLLVSFARRIVQRKKALAADELYFMIQSLNIGSDDIGLYIESLKFETGN